MTGTEDLGNSGKSKENTSSGCEYVVKEILTGKFSIGFRDDIQLQLELLMV